MTDVEALALELNSVAIHLVRRLRRSDAALGVAPARLSALSVLVFGGARTVSELADSEQVKVPTMTRVVQGLEESGLAERRPHPTDRRSSVVSATPEGKRLMLRGRQLRVKQLASQLGQLDDKELNTLAAAAEILRQLERT